MTYLSGIIQNWFEMSLNKEDYYDLSPSIWSKEETCIV